MNETNWIEWGGGDCPLHWTAVVSVKLRNGYVTVPVAAKIFEWDHKQQASDIVAYVVIRDPSKPKEAA